MKGSNTMKTLNELKETARNYFIENGMDTVGNHYFTNEKFEIKTETRYNCFAKKEMEYTEYNGLAIAISEVPRHNGTTENQSIRVYILKYAGTCGVNVYSVKIYSRDSDKKIAAQLASVLAAYIN